MVTSESEESLAKLLMFMFTCLNRIITKIQGKPANLSTSKYLRKLYIIILK